MKKNRFLEFIKIRVKTLHPDKTKIFSFGRFERGNSKNQNRKANTFDFLGFTHFCDISMNGYLKVGRKTAMKKFRAKIKELNIWLKQIRNLIMYPLPKPKKKHNFYTLSHKVVRYIEKPYEGNLQVRFCEGRSATPNYKLNKKEG